MAIFLRVVLSCAELQSPDTLTMSLLHTLKYITHHPLNRRRRVRALMGFLKWQIGSRLVPGPVVHDWVNGTRLIIRAGETGLTGNIYCGLHEFPDMAYVLHTVTEQDLFIDVGANAGSYTVLACAAKGARGLCFEPVPATFRRLLDNVHLNRLGDRVDAFNVGLADRAGELVFTDGKDSMNHVVADDARPPDSVVTPVLPLDHFTAGKTPSLIKIDVEGFETAVIQGAHATLRAEALHSVIMELNGCGARFGFNDDALALTMKGYGFDAYRYDPFSRTLVPLDGRNRLADNTLFVRDLPAVLSRIASAPAIRIGDVML